MDKKNGKSVIQRLKDLKHKEIILAVLAVAVMLAIYFSSFIGDSKSQSGEVSASVDYCARLQSEVTDAVKKMSGDKQATVIVNWESGVEAVIAYTTSESQSSSSMAPTILGSGKPVVLREIYPKPLGVVVVVAGASNVKLKLDVMNMVATLMDISPEKVAVFEGK